MQPIHDQQPATLPRDLPASPSTRLAKARAAKGTRLTAKQRKFAKEYVKTGNKAEAIRRAHPNVKDVKIASAMGIENLNKPIVRLEVQRLMQENGIELSEILAIHKRNMVQDLHLPTSQKAVSDFYEILGVKQAGAPSTDVKIAFVIER